MCYAIGHKWTGWYALEDDPPFDQVELIWARGPHPEVEVVWSRSCNRWRGCGALQMARATSLQIEDGYLKHANDFAHRFARSAPGAPEL